LWEAAIYDDLNTYGGAFIAGAHNLTVVKTHVGVEKHLVLVIRMLEDELDK
jgi:hypothetical protein